jgi:DNA repair photolyase
MEREPLFELRRTTFDTPEFRGIEFIEAEVKTILNHVPGTYLPFNWTINPYRGCSHACVYCVQGDTPILMFDGQTKPISEVRVGDLIFGTRGEGETRRYVQAEVLAHWSTVKPAQRATLADGTELVASGDHRFLTAEGWKYVAGDGSRPGLTTSDLLHGCGAFGEGLITDGGRVGPANDALRVESIKPLGVEMPMYDITTTTGDFIANGVVSHNCFARTTHTFMDMDAGRDFESKIVVKVNGPEVLRRQLAAKRWKGEHVAMGTATDPYQRAEGRYKLMPRIISALTDYRNPFSILTKGTLILRDLDLLVEASKVTSVGTAFSIGTLDEEAWKVSEPGTPHPRKRIEALAQLNEAGIPCGVLVAPILPGITDHPDQLREVVTAAIEAGATHVSPILLHLRPGIREEYMPWLQEHYPDLVPRYEAMYGNRSGYAKKTDQHAVGDVVRETVRDLGGPKPSAQVAARWRREELAKARAEAARRQPPTEQLSLL